VFGDKHTGLFLWRYSWFPVKRHILVRGGSSKDDPQLTGYWAARDRARATTASNVTVPLLVPWVGAVDG
jgi:RNA-directed DNA polymerase